MHLFHYVKSYKWICYHCIYSLTVFLDLSMIFFQNLLPSSSSGDGIEWHRTTPYKLSNLFVFFSHLCSFPSSLSLSKTAMTQQTYHKCFIMFYCEMFGCSGLHCFLFTGAASLPQLWLGSPASGFKRLAAKQAVGRDMTRPPSSSVALAPLMVMASEMIPSFSRLILTMFGSRTNITHCLHMSAPCSAPSTCCQCHPCQPGTKRQCHSWISTHGWFPLA